MSLNIYGIIASPFNIDNNYHLDVIDSFASHLAEPFEDHISYEDVLDSIQYRHNDTDSTFIERVKEKSKGLDVLDSITPGQHFIKMVLDEMSDFLGSENSEIKLNSNKMSTIVLAGLQGSGKTTTSVKIGCFLKREYNKKPLLVGLDLQRPAAADQLKVLAENNKLEGNFVEIKILDKVSSKNSILKLEIGIEKKFENLIIKFLKCKNSEFDDSPDITAYLQVKDVTYKENDKVFVFNGWTFASSPSLKPFDHPVYDIWLTKCY